jgi:hypothetical protein
VVQSAYRLQCPQWRNPPALQKKKEKKNFKFLGNQLSDSHISVKDANELLPVI